MLRSLPAVALLIALAGFVPVLSGCTDFDLDKLDYFNLNKKKPLPGKRVELFPNGVPGVTKGIPPQYMKGYQPPPDNEARLPGDNGQNMAATAPAKQNSAAPERKTAAVTPAEPLQLGPTPKPEPKPAHKAKRKSTPRHKAKRKPKPKRAPQPASQAQNQSTWPTSKKPTAPWPTENQPQQGASAPWPSPTQDATQPWPSPPPPGTFSK